MTWSTFNSKCKHRPARGFSLVEVIVAVGIFALAIVGVIGLLVPTSKNITEVADSDSAARVISAIQSGLQKAGFVAIKGYLDAPNPADATFYASKDGSKIGTTTSASWTSDAEKFFKFTLVRNESLSKADADDSAGFLAFTIVLRWPAYSPINQNQSVEVDASQQSVMVVPAAITR